MTTAAEPSAAVDLAQEADFRLGGLFISPSAGRVRAGDAEQRVEPRVMEVLVVLVRNAGRTVSRDQLIEACWGGRIVSDDAVNRVLAQVRALARLMEPPPFALDTVPKVGVRLIPAQDPSGAGHPPAAPASPQASVASARRPRPWLLAVAAAAVVVLVAAGLWIGRGALRPSVDSAQNGHVEVMQFEARTPDAAVKQTAADISQDLVRVLSAADVQTAQEPRRRDDAGGDAELRIAGSVGLEAGKYVTTGQIIDRRSGIVLWADRVERTAEAQASSPGDFAAQVAGVLVCTLRDRRLARRPLSTEAMGLYLNACAAVFFGDDDGERMLAVTRRLVKAAPDFAAAHAMHAIGAALVSNKVTTPAEAAALHAESTAAAATAIKLDRRAAKAYSALAINEGVWRDQLEHNWFAEEKYLLLALKYDPELAPARNEYASLLRSTGRTTEALEFIKVSSAADDPRYGNDPRVAMLMAANGDLAGAEAHLAKMEAHSRVSQARMRSTIAFWWEDPKTALSKVAALGADARDAEGQACLVTFLQEIAVRQARRAKGLPASCAAADRNWQVRMLAREGDVDGAFALLNGRIPGGPVLFYYPETRALRHDPRFWTIARRTGLVDYWTRSGHWPDFCAEPGIDCRAAARAAMAAAASSAASAPARTAGR